MADRAAAARQRLMQHSHSQATSSISTQAPCLPGSTQPAGGTSSQAAPGRVTLMQRLKLMGGGEEAPLPPQLLRKYIAYARAHVMPVLSDEAKDVLQVGAGHQSPSRMDVQWPLVQVYASLVQPLHRGAHSSVSSDPWCFQMCSLGFATVWRASMSAGSASVVLPRRQLLHPLTCPIPTPQPHPSSSAFFVLLFSCSSLPGLLPAAACRQLSSRSRQQPCDSTAAGEPGAAGRGTGALRAAGGGHPGGC
jgi:hypothetical protein